MKQFESQIIRNRQISADFFEMALGWGAPAGAPVPGQFLTIRVSGDTVPLLRRPFAFSGFDAAEQTVSIIYQRRGRGTEILAARQAGETVDVIGPLGNVFPVPVDGNPQKAIVAAGGVGLGPMLFLANYLRERGVDTELVFGCRDDSFIPDTGNFKNAAPRICTDNGAVGFKGNVVQFIGNNIKLDDKTAIYGCGPAIMLENLYRLAQSTNTQTWVSLESMMACGVGACMGCAVPMASGGYLRACKEGPVFDGREVAWERM